MKRKVLGSIPVFMAICSASSQPLIPIEFEVHGAEDIRNTFDPTFTDGMFNNARGIAASGDTLIISRSSKISTNNIPMEPFEFLVYRRNLLGEYELKARNGDTVVGAPGVSLAQPREWYGWKIALSGNTLAVGASYYPYFDDSTSITPNIMQDTLVGYGDMDLTGAVFVYTRPDALSDAWTLQQVIYNSDPVNGERFGHDLMFHEDRLLIASPREFVPGFSGAPGGGCQNVRGKVSVYEFSATTSEYELVQGLIPPFMIQEASYGWVSNGDPVDMNGGCSGNGVDVGIPGVHSRQCSHDGDIGWDKERVRDMAVDGDWLVTVAAMGMYVYKYDHVSFEYVLHSTVHSSESPTALGSPKGWTSIDISDGVIIVSAKAGAGLPGWTRAYGYDQVGDSWVEKATYEGDGNHTGGSPSVHISNDQVLIYNGKIVLRYIRTTGELLLVGKVDFPIPPGGAEGPNAAVVHFEDVFLLPDNRDTDFGVPMNVRAISSCPQDLNNDGLINYFDLSAYMGLYNANDSQADYAVPYGVFDMDDVNHYLALYNSGCQ